MDEDENRRCSRIVSLIAFGGFVLLLALVVPSWSPSTVTWLKSWRVLESTDPRVASDPSSKSGSETAAWSDAEVKAALMQCLKTVAPINADLAPIAPVRDGECGTPAPVLLSSVGNQDKVVFDPALLMNCPMVIALHRWLNDVVQPAAKEAFGSPVARVIGSSYACRTVYNEPNGHLSQHAFANAVDVPTFILVDGRKVDVTGDWGPTERDLSAQQKSKTNKKAATDLVKVSTSTTPKDQKQAQATKASLDAEVEAKFLRLVLQGACQTFSTVLGPESNDVHRTHFHLDLKEGNSVKVCK